jgi:signal peptidase I
MKVKVSCKPSIAHIDIPIVDSTEDISETLIESSQNNYLEYSIKNTSSEYPTETSSTYTTEDSIAVVDAECSEQEIPKTQATSTWRELGRLTIKIAVIAACFLLVFTFLYGFHRNTDPDMAPMIKDGDLLLFYRLDNNYNIGDLLLLDFQGERQVRRVVARAGDTVDITEDGLIINGGLRNEPEIFQQTLPYENGILFPLTVGEGQVFTLGDARENATDSRVYGPIDMEDTLGTVITVMRRRGL